MRWIVGDLVRATCRIEEDESILHAEQGSSGTVEYVDEDGNPTVRFHRTGTSTVCLPGELKLTASVGVAA